MVVSKGRYCGAPLEGWGVRSPSTNPTVSNAFCQAICLFDRKSTHSVPVGLPISMFYRIDGEKPTIGPTPLVDMEGPEMMSLNTSTR